MRLAVVGTGYVGLVVGAGLADCGNDVVCVDAGDGARAAQLAAGELPLYEPGLSALLQGNVEAGRLRFSGDLEASAREAELLLLALPVEVSDARGADLRALFEVADRLALVIRDGTVVVNKSTVPVGTLDRLKIRMEARSAARFAVVSNPTFLRVGSAVSDFMRPDRVIIGTDDTRAAELVRRLYSPLVRTPHRVFVLDARSAELAKYASSALLASRISFMNELALLADDLGADIEAVRQVMGADPRIGPRSLFVGPGYGGSHFHNDITMLVHTAAEAGHRLEVVRATRSANQRQKRVLLHKLTTGLSGRLEGKRVAVWGLSYKPRTDDVGQSPALELVAGLLEGGAEVAVHDPQALPSARARFGDRLRYASDMYEAAERAHALVLVTEWHQYRSPDFGRLRERMAGQLLVDGRNVWDRAALRELGFRYLGIGRS